MRLVGLIILIGMSHYFASARAEVQEPPMESCLPEDQFKFSRIELKLNMDGNPKKDAVVRFEAGEGDDRYFRRALVLDANEKPAVSDRLEWLEPCRAGGENPDVSVSNFERISAGSYDLLLAKEEGAGSLDVRYFVLEGKGLKTALKFIHPSPDGHLTESHTAQVAKVRVTGEDGDLEVNGVPVDLDGKSLAARCRVRELYVQLQYEWDRKGRAFKEKKQGCVMGASID